MDAIFKKFHGKTNFKKEINVIRKLELQIYPAKPSIGLPNLVRLSL
jgi:hypothetical protein